MLAAIYNKSSEYERNTLFDSSKDKDLDEVLLYQSFIHDIIWGKPEVIAKSDYEKWVMKSIDEKKALRLIAFLNTDKSKMSKETIEKLLYNYKFKLPSTPLSLISAYFSFDKTDDGSEIIEFIHKSFQEYLLAEFYLESIFNGKCYRLVGKEPTPETYNHLKGLIKFVTSDDPRLKERATKFTRSFYEDINNVEEFELINFIEKLLNSINYVKQQDLVSITIEKDVKIWNMKSIAYSDLKRIWLSKWICIFISANKLFNNDNSIDDEFLKSSSFYIRNSTHLILNKYLSLLKLQKCKLEGADLSEINLSNAELFNAEFVSAHILRADLSGSNLSGSNLSSSNIYGADLSNTQIDYARLYGTILSDGILPNARLSYSELSNANLSNANLSNAIILNCNMSNKIDSQTNLKYALKDDENLMDILREAIGSNNLPILVRNKIDLTSELRKKKYDEKSIQYIIYMSGYDEEDL